MMNQLTRQRPVTNSGVDRDNDARWAAISGRDKDADDAFVYAVRSTGIFCVASCPSRRPRRENVNFFASATEAVEAGYRPCLRCRPDRPDRDATMREAIIAACRRLDEADERIALDAIARDCGMSRSHFQRSFKSVTGTTPAAYAAAKRAERVRALMRASGTATQAAYEAGFNSASRFYAHAEAQFGMAPRAWRKGGAGETIRFAIGTSSLGDVLVGATVRGVCAILIGDDADALLRNFQDQFSKAELIGNDSSFNETLAAAIALVERPSMRFDLPLDIAGTLFQQKVWAALRAVPPGITLSYTELAERIGAPAAVRAVARACASNRIAVAIPCHRIVRADGDLSGYRWGIARKAELLKRERA